MSMLSGRWRSGVGVDPVQDQRIAHWSRRTALVPAWLAVVALYAVSGAVVPADAAKLPTVTSVTPSSGPATGGTSVTIEGTFFKNVRAVKFGVTNAASFTVNGPTSITATSPAAAVGAVDVTVTIPGGRTSATSPADHFEFTPTVTGVSPNTGPPAGGTPVTITGSGFAVGTSATHITFGEEGPEAVGVNCPTTTECTATTPELERFGFPTPDVIATVNNVISPQSPADIFHYHGLYLVGEFGRLPVGADVRLVGFVEAGQANECSAFLGGRVNSNGQTTDELGVGAEEFSSCFQEQYFGALPFNFTLYLGVDGSATIEGAMGVRPGNGCVYEGDRLTGSVGLNAPLEARVGGTLKLVAEEVPGTECAATESVSVVVGTERTTPATEVVG
jgi:hypothetical protein